MVQYAAEALGMDKPGQKEALPQKVCDNIERVGQSWCIVTALWKGKKFSVLKHMSPDLTARDKVILATLVGSVDILGPLRLNDNTPIFLGARYATQRCWDTSKCSRLCWITR
jgi:hypothetical protein